MVIRVFDECWKLIKSNRFLSELMPSDNLLLLQYNVHSVVFLLERSRLDDFVKWRDGQTVIFTILCDSKIYRCFRGDLIDTLHDMT